MGRSDQSQKKSLSLCDDRISPSALRQNKLQHSRKKIGKVGKIRITGQIFADELYVEPVVHLGDTLFYSLHMLWDLGGIISFYLSVGQAPDMVIAANAATRLLQLSDTSLWPSLKGSGNRRQINTNQSYRVTSFPPTWLAHVNISAVLCGIESQVKYGISSLGDATHSTFRYPYQYNGISGGICTEEARVYHMMRHSAQQAQASYLWGPRKGEAVGVSSGAIRNPLHSPSIACKESRVIENGKAKKPFGFAGEGSPHVSTFSTHFHVCYTFEAELSDISNAMQSCNQTSLRMSPGTS